MVLFFLGFIRTHKQSRCLCPLQAADPQHTPSFTGLFPCSHTRSLLCFLIVYFFFFKWLLMCLCLHVFSKRSATDQDSKPSSSDAAAKKPKGMTGFGDFSSWWSCFSLEELRWRKYVLISNQLSNLSMYATVLWTDFKCALSRYQYYIIILPWFSLMYNLVLLFIFSSL